MHRLFDDRYNDFSQDFGYYSVGNKLMMCFQNDTTGNTQPIYISLSDGVTTISNLEMCGVGDRVFVMDLAPFIQTYFTEQLKPFEITYNNDKVCKKIHITVDSYGEESGSRIEYDIWCTNRSLSNPEIVQNAEWTYRAGSENNVYISDVKANDFSPIIMPTGYNLRFYNTSYGFGLDDGGNKVVRVYTPMIFVSDNASKLDVRKQELINGAIQSIVVGQRPIIRKNYCSDKNLLILYRTPYNNFEYFVFDSFTKQVTVAKSDNIYNNLYRNGYYNGGFEQYGQSESIQTTASVVVSDDVMASKWNDIIKSTQVYIYNPTDTNSSIYSIQNFERVTVDGNLTINPRRGSRQSLTLTKTNEYLW